jgi:hypothetical protein
MKIGVKNEKNNRKTMRCRNSAENHYAGIFCGILPFYAIYDRLGTALQQ